jgi:glucose/arabinose dehydrogenase
MRHAKSMVVLAVLVAGAGVTAYLADARADNEVLTGQAAFGSWEENEPGTSRLIRPSDMPAPYATKSASNAPAPAEMPAGAKPVVPSGFKAMEFARGLRFPRVIEIAPNGDVFVAASGSDKVRVFRMDESGAVVETSVFASDLDQPYGIAFYPPSDPRYVYVANTGSVVRFPYRNGDMTASGEAEAVIPELPVGHHWTRDLAVSADGGTLFVSVGSGSNVAEDTMEEPAPEGFVADNPLGATWGEETDRADVLAFDPDGGNKRVYATGLRNCSGMTVQPATGDLWCVVNERDALGDDLPPDYATRIYEGKFYGWPWYYIGSNEDPRLKGERPDLAGRVTIPDVLFQAHSAPLGIAFYDGDAFPAEYKGDAFVAMHGSWNRDHRTGYKVVRLIFDEAGKPTGVYQDFLTGFVLDDQSVWGRPVDVKMAKDGSLLVSDDGSGIVWRVTADN